MVISNIIGGLGNQMFQYAFGYTVSKEKNAVLKLDISGFASYGLRAYQLNLYNLSSILASDDEIQNLKGRKENLFAKIIRKTKKKPVSFKNTYYKEPHFNFDENVFKLKGDFYFEGYWQSEKYFQNYRKELLEIFSLKNELHIQSKRYQQSICTTNSVSLHIRRGDYVTNLPTNTFHGTCDLSYYQKAVELMEKKINKPHFFIFSDDLDWAKDNLDFIDQITFVELDKEVPDHEEMYLMSQCKHNIIANSSFSWWGAWLNKNPNKIVIAPIKWFNDLSIDTNDLIPEDWIRLSNNPIVSVIMPVYNGEKYLREAIQSILNQTFIDFEFIILNDGSTDKTEEIILAYDDPRIHYIKNETNLQLVETLNKGIKFAKGKYVARMDADDISLPTRLEEQVKFMEDNPDIGISGSAAIVFGENINTSIWKLLKNNEAIKSELLFSSTFAHPSVIMNKKMILKYNLFYDNNFLHAEDFELWTRMAKVTKMANISKPLLKYRVVENSITREANKNLGERYLIHKKIFNTYLEELDIQNSEEEKKLHFYVSINERIKEHEICFEQLEKYFNKIIDANKSKKIFNNLELKKVLGKKWLANIYYTKNISKVFSKYFLYGIWGLINKWIA